MYICVKRSNHLSNYSIFSLDLFNKDRLSVFQPDNLVWSNSVKSFFVLQLYIRSLDINSRSELYLSIAFLLVFGEKRNCQYLRLFQILNNQLYWLENSHSPRSPGVQVCPNMILKQLKMNIVLITSTSNSNSITEIINSLSRVPSSSHSVYGQQSRIVPSIDIFLKDQIVQSALGKNHMSHV